MESNGDRFQRNTSGAEDSTFPFVSSNKDATCLKCFRDHGMQACAGRGPLTVLPEHDDQRPRPVSQGRLSPPQTGRRQLIHNWPLSSLWSQMPDFSVGICKLLSGRSEKLPGMRENAAPDSNEPRGKAPVRTQGTCNTPGQGGPGASLAAPGPSPVTQHHSSSVIATALRHAAMLLAPGNTCYLVLTHGAQ